MSAKVVPLRKLKPKQEREKEVVFLDAEDEGVDVRVQTNNGKVDIWDWIQEREGNAAQRGYKLASYYWGFVVILLMAIIVSAYSITFWYQAGEHVRSEKERYDFHLLHKPLDLDSYRVFSP